MDFRPVTEKELFGIANAVLAKHNPPRWQKEYETYAKKFFPAEVTYFLVQVNSNYNDEGYNNTVDYVIAYDAYGEEVNPIKDTADQARTSWKRLPVPVVMGEDNDFPPDFGGEHIVRVANQIKLPQLFINQTGAFH